MKNWPKMVEILQCDDSNGWAAKYIGDTISVDDHWLSIQGDVMNDITQAAARDDLPFRDYLLSTGDRPLLEDTYNPVWGALNGGGNLCGNILVSVRSNLSQQNVTNRAEVAEPWRKWLLNLSHEPVQPVMPDSTPTSLPSWTQGWLSSSPQVNIEPDTNSHDVQGNTSQSQTTAYSVPSFPPFNSPSPLKSNPNTSKTKKQKHIAQLSEKAKVLYFSDSMGHKVNPSVQDASFISSAHSGAKVVYKKGKTQPSLNLLKDAMQGDETGVVLQYGANDVTTDIPVSQFKLHYARLAKQASTNGAWVICCGILHRGDGKADNVKSRNTRVDELNQAIMEVCYEDGYTYMNNTSAIRSSSNNPRLDLLNRSKLHLNQNGKQFFAGRLAHLTFKVLKSGTIPCPQPSYNKKPPSPKPPSQRRNLQDTKEVPRLLDMNSTRPRDANTPPFPANFPPPPMPPVYMANPYNYGANPYTHFSGPMSYPHFLAPRPMY